MEFLLWDERILKEAQQIDERHTTPNRSYKFSPFHRIACHRIIICMITIDGGEFL